MFTWPMWVKQNGKSREPVGTFVRHTIHCFWYMYDMLLCGSLLITLKSCQCGYIRVGSGILRGGLKRTCLFPDETVVSIWQAYYVFELFSFNHQLTTIITSTMFFCWNHFGHSYLIILEEKQLVVVEDVDASHNHWGSSLFSDAPDAVSWTMKSAPRVFRRIFFWWWRVFCSKVFVLLKNKCEAPGTVGLICYHAISCHLCFFWVFEGVFFENLVDTDAIVWWNLGEKVSWNPPSW